MRNKLDFRSLVRPHETQQGQALSLLELVESFSRRTLSNADQRLGKFTVVWGGESAWAITPDQLEAVTDAMICNGYSVATANRDISTLGTIYRWARDQRLTPRGFRSPTLGVKRFEEPIRRVEISSDQIQALRSAALTATRDRRFGCFIALLVDTGARRSEVLDRRWSEVDLDAGMILCPTTKTGIPRILHFRPETASLLRRVYPHRSPETLLFEGRVPGRSADWRRPWSRITHEVGIPDLHLHDLRHAAAARLLRAGVTVGVAAQVLGHSVQVLARRYGHLETATLRQAQELAWQTQT